MTDSHTNPRNWCGLSFAPPRHKPIRVSTILGLLLVVIAIVLLLQLSVTEVSILDTPGAIYIAILMAGVVLVIV